MAVARLRELLGCCLAATVAAGCSATRDDPRSQRFYSPEAAPLTTATPIPSSGPALRLGWVRAAEHLGFRFVQREREQVYAYHERRRWNESPVVYLERALRRRLFVEQGLDRSLSPDAPSLDVTLLAFEEVRGDGGDVGRVVVAWVLLAGERHLGEGTIRADEPLGEAEDDDDAAGGAALAAALGRALERALDQLGRAVEEHVKAR